MNWVHPEKFNLANYSHDGSIGCFLQVDPGYPEEVYDYPLAAEETQKNLILIYVIRENQIAPITPITQIIIELK